MTTAASADLFPKPGASAARAQHPSALFGFLKPLLKPVASLRLTVLLLVMAILLVFAGTSAQKELGIWDVQNRYFYAWWCWIPFKYLFPLSTTAWTHFKGGFFFPGGYSIIAALLVNLLAAHTLRFKLVKGDLLLVPLLVLAGIFAWRLQLNVSALWITLTSIAGVATLALTGVFHKKRTGVIVIHFALILLLAGELLSSGLKHEGQLRFREGDTRQWVHDIHHSELAVVEAGAGIGGKDRVTVIADRALDNDGHTIRDAALPFDVRIEHWYDNAQPLGPMQGDNPHAQQMATTGSLKSLRLLPMSKFTGVEAEQVDAPAAFLTILPKNGGQPLGTYALSVYFADQLQDVTINGKTYGIALRFERTYFPYSITLLNFAHDKYAGTDTARNFASRIRLDDPAAGSPREVTIKMNAPLRYEGRTFFQSSFNPEDPKETTLQVVDNPVWTMPYLACVIGAIGLVTHFGMHLVGFLRKRASAGELFDFTGDPSPHSSAAANAPRKAKKGRAAETIGSYTLPARGGLAGVLVPLAIIGLFALDVIGHAASAPRAPEGQPDIYALGQIPVSFDGRTMPLDTLARASMKILSGKDALRIPKKHPSALARLFDMTTEKRPAMQWLADVLSGKPEADQYRVFRVDHPDIKSMLGLDDLVDASRRNWKKGDPEPLDGKSFSYADILYSRPGNAAALQQQVDAARKVPGKRQNLYQRKVLELYEHLSLQMRLAQVGSVLDLSEIWSDPKRSEQFANEVKGLMGVDPASMTPEQRVMMSRADKLDQQIRRLRQLQQDETSRTQDVYFVPPETPAGEWRGLGQTFAAAAAGGSLDSLPSDARDFLSLMRDYRDGNAASFNAGVTEYAVHLGRVVPKAADKAEFENFFNRFDPFFISFIIYIGVFVCVLVSWVGFQRPMWRSAAGLLLLALLVHSIGLVMRVLISGRPPVTSLYSSAVFIAWGAVVMAVLFEVVFRNGLGLAVAGAVGSLSLLIAGGLSTEGDTMKQLQAVLDTNFWLATHVIIITLGYAATFLAMGLAVAYVIGGMATPNLDKDLRKNLYRMVYGVTCFAMLFSFVGTILGGIWADQSWGRFWGWDPKENGAILIVLWVAVTLHARWGGLVKEKGFMALTVLGGTVTGWSWFGTNMMGVGLHSYGFMESGIFWLAFFTAVILGITLLTALVPQRLWWSFRAESGDAGAAGLVRGEATA